MTDTIAAYLKVVRTRFSQADTRPYHQPSKLRGAPARLPLLDEAGSGGVYVPLRFDLHLSRSMLAGDLMAGATPAGRAGGRRMERDRSRTDVPLAEVLSAPGHLVLIGAAGSGKTTILRLIAAILAAQDPALARTELALDAVSIPSLPIPIFLALRDFEYACQTRPDAYRHDVDSLLRFLDDHFQRWHPGIVPGGFLGGLVRGGRAWLLLDALDEVADFNHRLAVRQVIESLADAFPQTRLLVTARVAAYSGANTRLDERFHLARIRDLVREQWASLIERLYASLEADPGVAAEQARRLLARIDGASTLQEMVKTPLMVWTATLIHYAGRELPEQRAELYRAYVDVLLGERLHEEESAEAAQHLRQVDWPAEDRRLYLTYAAYQVHQQAEHPDRKRQDQVIVDERDLVRHILAPFLGDYLGLDEHRARHQARDFVTFMAERSGLLYAHEEGYSFGDHLTIQEFLAANYVVDNLRGSDRWADFLQEHVGRSWWQEVFMLMAGYLLRWPQQARRFLLEELGRLPGEGNEQAYGLAWAGRALLEIPEKRVGWHANVRAELARHLVGVLWQNPPTTSVAARLEAGRVLGRLGDPRFSGEPLLPEFIPIPAGPFWMGSDEAEVERLVQETGEEWFRRELPRHRVELTAFALSRYPTTNAMFECFIRDSGYADERWWAEARADGVWRPDGTVRDWWGTVRDRPAYWDDARFNGPNQPVVGVTWYEAAAYCRWLTDRMQEAGGTEQGAGGRVEYRLPTEAEWERAARGPDGRKYPWGGEWQEGRANSKELGLEVTTPVGLFPDGASAENLLDMAGNVWEWCSDWYDEATYHRRAGQVATNPKGPGSGRYKVLRGGSWYNDKDIVRCAYRIWNTPDNRDDILGFRVARGPSR